MTTAQTMLWEELYRPQTFNDIVLPARIKKQFTTPGIIQNYLFHGPQGTGKSTLAKILAKQYNALFINASLRNDVQSIRTDIDNFCALQSLDSNRFKLVVFDEADHLSQAAQAALRGVIEEYNQTARFIFTCNYPEKLTDPIKSRLEEINFDFANPEEQNEQTRGYISRLVFIASANGMVCDKEAISFIFKKNYPDIRSMIQKLQNLHRSGITHATLNDVQKTSSVKYEDLFTFICK
jgi:replication factor C small subunit